MTLSSWKKRSKSTTQTPIVYCLSWYLNKKMNLFSVWLQSSWSDLLSSHWVLQVDPMLLWQQFLSHAGAWPQSSLVAQMVLACEENTSWWKDNSERRSSRTETRSSTGGTGWGNCYLRVHKNSEDVCARRLHLRKVRLPYVVRTSPWDHVWSCRWKSELWARQ